jgi:hypothetical protein
MYIAPAVSLTRAPAERNVSGKARGDQLSFRSAGARTTSCVTHIYKHFAPTGAMQLVLGPHWGEHRKEVI